MSDVTLDALLDRGYLEDGLDGKCTLPASGVGYEMLKVGGG